MKASDSRRGLVWLPLAIALLLLLFSVRGNSLWMDEGQTLSLLRHDSFSDMLRDLTTRGGAVSGMPLYFILEFFWCRLFGLGEFAMRSMNYLFAACILWGALRLIAEARLPRWSLLLFAAHPVLVYYMNEARPYAALYACGLWGVLFLFRCATVPGKRPVADFFVCWWLACALHLMAVFAAAAYACLLGILLWRKRLRFKDHLAVWLAAAPFFAALGADYLRFALNAPELGFPASPLVGIVQIGYYFAGLGGLGWSRQALRTLDFALTPRMALELSAALLAWLAFLVACIRAKLFRTPRIAGAFACAAAALGVFLAANIAFKTRFWERHVIYLLPPFLFVVASAGREILATHPGRLANAAVFPLLAAFLLSSCNLVWLPEYQKEDYRSAIAIARSLEPDHIFFQGNHSTLDYYGLSGIWGPDAALQPEAPIEAHVNISTLTWDGLRTLLERVRGRTVLLLLDRDEFDTAGFHKALAARGRRVNGFAIVDAADIPPEALSPDANPLWNHAARAW